MNKTLVAEVYRLHGSATVSISADSPLEEVIGNFASEPSLRDIFLVDSKQRFVGTVTEIDLIRWAHLKLTGGKVRHEIPVSEFCRIVDARKARDLASGDTRMLSLRESDTLQATLDKMLDYEECVIAVLDSEGTALGDISVSEIFWVILTSGRRTS